MRFTKQTFLRISLISSLVIGYPLASTAFGAAKPLGKTILARGDVVAERNNAQETLKRRSPVFRQDILRSGTNARAQFRMVDNALINLQQNSVLRLNKYELTTPEGDGSVLMELISGGLRTVTGAVGKKDKKDYQLRTPTATIGIRGTMYEVEIVGEGTYIAAWEGRISVQSHSGQCGLSLGDGLKNRFVFVNKSGACEVLDKVPEVFRDGHSSPVNAIPEGVLAEIEPLPSVPEQRNPELPYQALILGQNNIVAARGGAHAINTSQPLIDIPGLGFFLGNDALTFEQGIGGYQVSWGHWDDQYFSRPELSAAEAQVDDANGLLWMAYEATDTAQVENRSGSATYDVMVDSLAQSSMGAVTNLDVQMHVDFDDGLVTNGAISAHVPGYTWIGVFDGQVLGGDLSLQYNGGALVNANTGVSSDASGFIDGDFVGNNAQAIAGGFSMTETNNTNNQIEGFFVVKD